MKSLLVIPLYFLFFNAVYIMWLRQIWDGFHGRCRGLTLIFVSEKRLREKKQMHSKGFVHVWSNKIFICHPSFISHTIGFWPVSFAIERAKRYCNDFSWFFMKGSSSSAYQYRPRQNTSVDFSIFDLSGDRSRKIFFVYGLLASTTIIVSSWLCVAAVAVTQEYPIRSI